MNYRSSFPPVGAALTLAGLASARRLQRQRHRQRRLKLLARIRQFDFGAMDVELMVVTWPVDFLPS